MKINKIILISGLIISWEISVSQIINNPDIIICPSCVVNATVQYEQTENVIFIDPNNIIHAIVGSNSQVYPSPFTVGLFSTNDGGQTWLENYNVPQTYGDPTISIDGFGHYYLGRVNPGEIQVSKFDDLVNQTLWQNYLVDNINTPDKPHIWINGNNIYCGWTRLTDSPTDPKLHIYISKGDINNFNNPWTTPLKVDLGINASFGNHGINVCTGPQGQVYTVWSIYDIPFNSSFGTKDEDGLGFAKLDPAVSQIQSSKRFIFNIRGTRGSGLIGSAGTLSGNQVSMLPTIACNKQNGNIYIAWTNIGVPGINTGDPDIYFIKSTDQGATWSSPIRVNQDPINNNKNQFYATISCDPYTGVIAVGYLDSRNNHPLRDYYVSLSNDEGQNWYDYQVSDAPFDNTSGPGNDYTWVDIKNNKILPVWNQIITDPNYLIDYNNALTSPFSIACSTDVNNLCNINESSFQYYRASNTITVAGNPTSCYYNLLAAGGNVSFQAGNYVKFQDGFHAENGSTVHSYINTNCNLVGSLSDGNNQRPSLQNQSESTNEPSHKDKVKNFKVYPNPAQNKLYITFNLLQDSQTLITLNDITGREILILNKDLNTGFYKTEFDLSNNNILSGIYFLKLATSKNVKSIKFVKL